MSKLFTIAGTSKTRGVNTYRFATGKVNVRAAKLIRHGHTEVQLMQLPSPMSKKDAVAWLQSQGIFANMLKTGRGAGKVVELTPEQAAAAEAAAARLLEEAHARAAADAEYVAGLTGDPNTVVASQVAEEPQLVQDDDIAASYSELIDAVSGEVGVDADREIADEMQSS